MPISGKTIPKLDQYDQFVYSNLAVLSIVLNPRFPNDLLPKYDNVHSYDTIVNEPIIDIEYVSEQCTNAPSLFYQLLDISNNRFLKMKLIFFYVPLRLMI